MEETDDPEVKAIKDLFNYVSDNKPELSVFQFHTVLERMGIQLPFPLTTIVFNAIDTDNSTKIEFTEFFEFVHNTDQKLLISSEYEADFPTRPFRFTVVSANNGLPCIISQLHHSYSRERILPRSRLLKINGVDVSGMDAQMVNLELHKTKLPARLSLSKTVTKANLALMVEQGPWSMVHRDIEMERRKNKTELEKAKYVDGWHCPEEEGWQKHIFLTFDDEDYSALSRFVIFFVLILIFVSTIAYVLETIPILTGRPIFYWIEIFVSICFTIEYVVRILTCRNSWIFFWDYMNMIDFLAIVPFWIEMCFQSASGGAMLRVIRVIRLARVVKLAKNERFKEYLDVLFGALAKSIPSFGLLGTIILLNMIVFASLMFAAEGGKEQPDGSYTRPDGEPTPFVSIFAASWWCIVTMTCVGYGDMYPITVPGKIICVVTMFCGLLVIALPVIIVGGEFDKMYDDFRRKKKQRKRAKELKAKREFEKKELGINEETDLKKLKRNEGTTTSARASRYEEQHGFPTRRYNKSHLLLHAEDYFLGLNDYINRTCEGFSSTDTGVVQFFKPEEVTYFVEEGYETQDEIIEVLQQGPQACYFLPDKIKKWKLFALYEIFAKKHQVTNNLVDDPFRKLRVAFYKKTDLSDNWEHTMSGARRVVHI